MNKKNKAALRKILRPATQILFFILLPGLYSNAFLGIKLVYQKILEHNFSFVESFPQLIAAIAVIPTTLLIGRFFCGWMCAFGTMGDFLYYLSRKVFKVSYQIKEEADYYLKYIKYAVFLFILVVVWTIRAFDVSALSPWDAFANLVSFPHLPSLSYTITELTIGFILLFIILIGSLFIERFFCRYLCPLGAIFSIISHLKFIHIKKPSKDCGSCKACTKKCSMGILLYQMDSVSSGECIECMNCINVCPRENISITAANVTANSALTGTLAVTAITGIYYMNAFLSNTSGLILESSSIASVTKENTSLFADGTYEGSGIGFRGTTTTISVTISGGIITAIKAVSYGDDEPYFNAAFHYIKNQVLSTQTTSVDAVSGATFSSNGIIDAINNALENAKQEVNSSSNGNKDIPTVSIAPTITEAADATAAPIPDIKDDLKSDISNKEDNSSDLTDDITSPPTKAPTSISASAANSSDNISNESSASSSSNISESPVKESDIDMADDSGAPKNASSNDPDSSESVTPSIVSPSIVVTPTIPVEEPLTTNQYNDGIFEGSARGFRRGTTTVSITIKDDVITDIEIISNGDDAPFFNRACDIIISEILELQDTDVDAVSGATFSSNGIMNAVADALNKAEIN